MSTGQRHGVEPSTIVMTAGVVTFLGVAAALGLSGRAVPVLRRLVLNGPLVDALLLAWVVLVLLRNPYPGLAQGIGSHYLGEIAKWISSWHPKRRPARQLLQLARK
jgi:hypothetical protein